MVSACVSQVSSLTAGHECTWLYRENPDDCSSYYQCLGGNSVLRRCPPQLHWNAEGSYCDWEVRADCLIKRKEETTRQVLNGISGTYKNWFNGIKDDCNDGSFKPNPTDCNKYYQCVHGDWVPRSCSGGLNWNSKLNTCDWPSNANCKPSSSVSTSDSDQPQPGPQQIVATTTTTSTTTSGTTTTSRPTTTTKPPTTTSATTSKPQSSQTQYPILIGPNPSAYKIVCYYSSWANYRPDKGKFTPGDIDPTKCTHIIYAFAAMNADTYKLEMGDQWVDGPDGLKGYEQVTSFRQFGVKVLIAVGGWVDSGHPKWGQMLKDPTKMQIFIDSCYDFINKWGFDGIDLDYEYPTCPNCNCNFDSSVERSGFVILVKGLRQKFGEERLITAAVSANENIMREAYDIPSLSKSLSFFNVMAYDIHGSWEKITGHNAPFKRYDPDEAAYLNVEYAVRQYLASNAPPEKICVGVPFHAQNFELASNTETGLRAKAVGPGPAGPFTKQKGMLAYYEVCTRNWTTVHDSENRMGPYSYQNMQWVSYDDTDIIETKCEFVKDLGLGGVMIWSLDLDDFRGDCGPKYPLLKTINNALRNSTRVSTKAPTPTRPLKLSKPRRKAVSKRYRRS
ncbi:unnamed protein product [Orchesella dallaii]|uniref:Chitinase 3 n=1 Tax=Orchesella dallaii TaxID=48710 RepID=A0ABP1RSK6_9HEXA